MRFNEISSHLICHFSVRLNTDIMNSGKPGLGNFSFNFNNNQQNKPSLLGNITIPKPSENKKIPGGLNIPSLPSKPTLQNTLNLTKPLSIHGLGMNKEGGESIASKFSLTLNKTTVTFNFGTSKQFTSTSNPKASFIENRFNIGSFKPINLKLPAVKEASKEEEDENETEKSIPIEGTTGEEDEEILLNCKAKLYKLKDTEEKDSNGKVQSIQKTYVERGFGTLHFNKGNGFYRLIMRIDQVCNVCLNVRVFEKMNPQPHGKNSIRLMCPDEADNTKLMIIVLRLPGADETNDLLKKLKDAIADISASKA